MATLTYTTESKGFRYEDGNYVLTGNKVLVDDAMTSVDGGGIQKAGAYIGNFYVRFDGGSPIVSVNNVEASEMIVVMGIINALITALQA